MRFTITGHVSDPDSAWRLVGDTDHLNRVGGNPPLTQEMVAQADGFPALKGQMLGPVGIRHEFEEVDHCWVQGRWFRQERRIDGPLLRSSLYEAVLDSQETGVCPRITLEVEPAMRVLSPVLNVALGGVRRQWQKCLDALPAPGSHPEPEVLRRLDNAVVAAVERWRDRGATDVLVARINRLFQTSHAWELLELRPFELADRWGDDRDEVLTAFIEGTAAGVFEMYWSVRCPRCRAGVDRADSLSNLADHGGCPSCQIDFGVDLTDTVEVLFAAPPSLAPRTGEMFCTVYPARRPEVMALTLVQPQDAVMLEVPLAPGRWRIVAGSDIPDTVLVARPDITSGGLFEWRPQPAESIVRVGAGPLRLHLGNTSRRRLRISIIRDDWERDTVTAARMATLSSYRGVFGPQALAPDIRVSVRSVTVLFTDLTESTAFYVTQGDAAAFAFVRDHFHVLEHVVDDHDGVRVKTIGDAMMAAFLDPLAGVRAALAMHAEFARFAAGHVLTDVPRLRVGLTTGPALGVHTDAAGLDYFGGTVNLAARAVNLANGGEIVWPEATHELDEVAALVAAAGRAAERFEARPKGMPEALAMWRIR